MRPVTPTRRRWAALAAVLLGVAAVLVMLAVQQSTPPEDRAAPEPVAPGSVPPSTTSPASSSTGPSPDTTPAGQPAGPEHLSIPSIGVATDLIRLGLNEDRTVEVPENPARAGWFDQGPVPGQLGSSVVLGHVDSVDGPAVFFELAQLEPGSTVEVRLAGGSVATFRVDRVATYANEDFPAQEVYAGDPARRALNLVTCGGEYDAARGGWQSNVVVFTSFVSETGPA
jgi:sortase (surface protein transpeptidase)